MSTPHPQLRRDRHGGDTLEGLDEVRAWAVTQRLGGWMGDRVFDLTMQGLDQREAKVRSRLQVS